MEQAETRRARIKRIRQEVIRLGEEMEELGELGPEQYEELEGFDKLLALAREAAKDVEDEVIVTIKTRVKIKCDGTVHIPDDMDIDTYNAWDDMEAEYVDLVNDEGDFRHDQMIGQVPEVIQFCERAKGPYAKYVAAFNAFCQLHELEEAERTELMEELDEKINWSQEECDDDDDDDDVPF